MKDIDYLYASGDSRQFDIQCLENSIQHFYMLYIFTFINMKAYKLFLMLY